MKRADDSFDFLFVSWMSCDVPLLLRGNGERSRVDFAVADPPHLPKFVSDNGIGSKLKLNLTCI
jgi:hypothetical protein